MNARVGAIALALLCSLVARGDAQTPSPAGAENSRIPGLIRKLGSSSYTQREQARQELEAIGPPALDLLRQARRTSDVEMKCRIDELIRRGEEQVLTRKVLAPKEFQVKLVDADVDQALAELSKASGYPVQFRGDRTTFADKKITMDTGRTTFWQALDQFCAKAGLIERIDLTPKVAATSTIVIRKGRIRQSIDLTPAPTAPEPVILMPGGSEKVVSSYAGAVKTQLRVSRDEATKDLILTFVISVEPRLLKSSLEGRPAVAKVLDAKSRKLAVILEEKKPAADTDTDQDIVIVGGMPFNGTFANETLQRRHTQIRLKEADAEAKRIKELAGKLTVQVDLANETIARVDKILEAAGRSVPGVCGGTLKVDAVRKAGDNVEVQVTMENLIPDPFGVNFINNGMLIRGGGRWGGFAGQPAGGGFGGQGEMPQLIDAKGEKYLISNFSTQGTTMVNGSVSTTATIVFVPKAGQGAPRELVVYGTRTHTIAVPFRFENVPLP